MKKNKIAILLATSMVLNIAVPVIATPIIEEVTETINSDVNEGKVSNMEPFILDRNPKFSEYRAVMEIQRDEIESVSANGGHYYTYAPERAIDGNNSTFWETKKKNSSSFTNEFTVEFKELEEIAKMTYRIRSSLTGFLNEYEIYGSKTSDGDDFELITTGRGSTTSGTVEINFDPTEVKRVKIVFVKANNDWASIAELDFYRPDPLMEEITRVFADNLYTVLSEEYDTIEEIEALEEQVLLHPYKDDYMSTINLAKDIINGIEVERSDIYTLSQRGNENTDKSRIRKRYAGGNLDLTGYYIMPGETIEIYVDADENGVLPQVVFAQVGVAEIDDNFRTNLEPGKNVVGAPAGYTQPFAVYFANRALPEDQEYAPRVTIKGDNLQEYPIYIDGVTDPEEYIEEVKNHTGANMTDVMGDTFLVSARNSEAKIAYVDKGASPLDLVEAMDGLVEIYNDISGLYEDDEDPAHRPSKALYHAKFTNLSGIYAGNDFIHSTWSAARTILAGGINGWAMLHEFAHQVEGVGLMQSEITTNIYSVAASQIYGKDLGYRFDSRQITIDDYLVNGGTGYTGWGYHEKLLVIYQIINYFGIDTYSEAYRNVRTNWSKYPSTTAVQAIVAAFSDVTGYDLAPHFELYNYPVADDTKEYTSQFKPLDLKIQYTTLDVYDMIQDSVQLFDEETKAVIESVEKVKGGFELELGTSDNNDGTIAYEIYRDGELVGISREDKYVDQVDLSDSSKVYEYEVITYDYRVNESIKSDKVIAEIDGTPSLEVVGDLLIEIDEDFNPLDYVTAIAHDYTEINKDNIKVENGVDTTKEGIYEVVYEVESNGYTVSKTMNVQVVTRFDYISDMNWVSATTGYKDIVKDGSVSTGNKIKLNIDGEVLEFDKGIGTVANSEIVYDISDLDYDYFTAYVGPDENYSYTQTSFTASVIVDGEEVYKSDLFKNNSEAEFVKIPLDGAFEVKLVIDDGDNGITGDFTAWANSKFIYNRAENESIITYELNGGTGIRAQKVVNGESPILREVPTKSGYLFAGWYSNSGLTTEVKLSELVVEEDITLYAKWQEAHTLSFNLNGGEGDFQPQVIAVGGSPLEPTEVPTKEGYKFVGWYMDGNLTKPMIFNEFTISRDGSVFAKWAEASKIRFELNGGLGDFSDQLVIDGESPIVTEEPTKEGYIFDGWYTDSELTTSVNPNEVIVEEDTTFYAKWLRVDIVIFELNGGEGNFSSQEIIEGETLTVTEEPTKEGHAFAGWYADSSLTVPVQLSEVLIEGDTTFYAKWYVTKTLIFELNGGEGDFPAQTIILGESPIAPTEEPTKEGYVFEGWYMDGNLTRPMNFEEFSIENDGTVFAKWKKLYTLEFDLNDGEGNFPNQIIPEGGNPVAPTEEPTREGYVFDGWYKDGHLTKPMIFEEWVMSKDGAVFAKWRKLYTLEFDLNGGEGNFPAQVIPEGGSAVAPTEEPTKEGYRFAGWYRNGHLTNPMIFEEFAIAKDGAVFAKWEKINNVIFELNGGEGNFSSQELVEGERLTITEEPTREGYLFDGWYTDSEFTNSVDLNELLIIEDTTFYAKWLKVITRYDYLSDMNWISGTSGYENVMKDQTVTYENKIKLNIDGEVTEFDKGIATVADSEVVYDITDSNYDYFTSYIGPDENYNYTQTSLVFKVIVDGEEVYESEVFTNNSEAEFIKIPVAGASEVKLVVDDNGDGIRGDFASWADAKFVYDVIEERETVVSFELNGGTGATSQRVIKGESPELEKEPVKVGFLFGGWYSDRELTLPVELSELVVEEEVTLYSKWNEATTLQFELNGGEGNFPTQTIAIGGNPTAPTEEPTKEGYRFVGWYIDGNLTKPMVFEEWVMEQSGTTFAKWISID